jgi:hypothetical protein
MEGSDLFRREKDTVGRKVFEFSVVTAISLDQVAAELIHVRTIMKLHDKTPRSSY